MATMYRTINKVLHGKKKPSKASELSHPPSQPEKNSNSSRSTALTTNSGSAYDPIQQLQQQSSSSLRPESPLRLGSPSVAAIGEATLKKAIRRVFYNDPSLANGDGGRGGAAAAGKAGSGSRTAEVPTEMLAFEIGSVMRRMLEIYDSMCEKQLSSLRSNLQAPGVVTLISSELRVLWGLAGYEKQQELALVASRVAVLGRKCTDVRLHDLRDLFAELNNPEYSGFKKYSLIPPEGEVLIRFMREQADATNTLKSEMESIQLLHTRIQECGEWNSLQEMVTQGKLVEKLQGHCLWAYNLDYLVQLLVVAVAFLRKRIFASFGHGTCPPAIRDRSLGSSGLALHYANMVVLLERIIQQPDAVLGPTRDELYDMLPRNIQYLLRVQLQDPSNFVADGRVEANLKRGLLLLPTMAHNTIHWHSLHTPGAMLDSTEVVFQVQTFYYANRDAVNAALVDVLLGLCRICGVENPIGCISVASHATADVANVVTKSLEEENKCFRKQLGLDDRDDIFGGQVIKTEDVRVDRRRTKSEEREGGKKGASTDRKGKEFAVDSFFADAMAELASDRAEGEDVVEGSTHAREEERQSRRGDSLAFMRGDVSEASTSGETDSSQLPKPPVTPKAAARFRRALSARLSADFTRRADFSVTSEPSPRPPSRSQRPPDLPAGPASPGGGRFRSVSGHFGVPRQASADAVSGGRRRGEVQDSQAQRSSPSSSSSSPSSQRWTFSKARSLRVVVEGEGGGLGGDHFPRSSGSDGSNSLDSPGRSYGAPETPTSRLRSAVPAGGLVGCFTGAVADSESESEGTQRSSSQQRARQSRMSGRARRPPNNDQSPGNREERSSGGRRMTRHYYSQPIPLTQKRADL